MNQKVENLKGKLIVSCQALSNEPLHSSFIMGRMALAAKQGGASGIRANTKEDIKEIRTKESDLKELRHKAKEIQKEIEEKQKDELFKALVASGKTIDEVMRFIKATGEDKIE